MFDKYRRRLMSRTAPESLAGLSRMELFLQGGRKWTKGAYHRPNGTKCLVGAADYTRGSSLDHAKVFVLMAVRERGYGSIESFNDSRASFAEIENVLNRARQLACAQMPAPVVKVLPVVKALPPPDASGVIDLMPVREKIPAKR